MPLVDIVVKIGERWEQADDNIWTQPGAHVIAEADVEILLIQIQALRQRVDSQGLRIEHLLAEQIPAMEPRDRRKKKR